MSEEENKSYRVLARKYRPQNFSELIGQDALVRTLSNAIESGRIAHAFMLTGIRGTGKTTTARIIAKALNYTGPDGTAGPSTGPTEDCEICQAITQDRHPDIMEMDAASRTGVDDIREILDGVRYAPTSARYKVYIIDEVHMLSKAAFNALLKTLEEPPSNVIFIFATTEIRKVPVTVLSRCQRFDLRRVDGDTLADYYKTICGHENIEAEDEAIALIARAADGSVRDGLSLLDQAIALTTDKITVQQVQDMLGLADQTRVLDALDKSLTGDCAGALDIVSALYRSGADPEILLRDMLDFVHLLTRQRAVPQNEANATLAPDTMKMIVALAQKFSMPTLGRAWQIILKGLDELAQAPQPYVAAEMIIIRLAYAADLPDPAELIRKLETTPAGTTAPSAPIVAQTAPETSAPQAPVSATTAPVTTPSAPSAPQTETVASYSGTAQAIAVAPTEQAAVITANDLRTLEDIEAYLTANGQVLLASELYQFVHLVKMEQGRIEIRIEPEARQHLASELTKTLSDLTQTRWLVSVSQSQGDITLVKKAEALLQKKIEEAKTHPVVNEVLTVFPGAVVSILESKDRK